MNLAQAISLSTLRFGGPGSGRHPEGTAGRKTEDLATSRGWKMDQGKSNNTAHVYTRQPSEFSGNTEELQISKGGGWMHYDTEGNVTGSGEDAKSLGNHLGGRSGRSGGRQEEPWPSDELLGE